MNRMRRGVATLVAMTMMMALMAVGPTGAVADPGDILYRVNAGGATLAATDAGPDYLGVDADGTGGGITVSGTTQNSTSEPVDLTGVTLPLAAGDAEDLFQVTLYTQTDMSWAFDVPNATYEVKLHLIEQQDDFVVGSRVVDIAFEGAVLLDDLDVYEASGGTLKAHTETVVVDVADGVLNIVFTSVESYPNIRGIEITETTAGADIIAPVITLNGSDDMTVLVGSTFTDPGATATDNVDGDISGAIVVVGSVNTSLAGDYTLTYDVEDEAGNPAIQKVRTVHVVAPVDPGDFVYRVNAGGPDIAMSGEPDFLGIDSTTPNAIPGLTISGDFAADVTLTDIIDMTGVDAGLPMELFQALMRTSTSSGDVISFDFDVPNGDYEVRLHWAEHNDTITGAGQRYFDVYVEDTLEFDDYDMYDESGGEDIAITEFVDTTVADGVLSIDIAQQESVAIIRGIEILSAADTTAPVITLLGADPLLIEYGDTYADPGATATDNVDGDITASIVVGGATVDTGTLGDYVVTYNVSDAATNPAVEVTRTVSVVDTTDPVITLLGANPMLVQQAATFVDPGATVTDNVDATATIAGVSTVNTAVLGDYTVTYDYTDGEGNSAITVVRDVTVTDDLPPVITLLGSNPQVIEVGEAYVEAGATAADNEDGDLTSAIVIDATGVNTAVVGDYEVDYTVVDSIGHTVTETRDVEVVVATIPVDTFIDDDDSIFEDDIEWLAAMGITKGCNPPVNDMFCPTASTTRGQMAAFFNRALGSILVVDMGDAIDFVDTGNSVFVQDIAWLSAAGITEGCNPPANDEFCAADLVTRGQMAAFLHRAFGDLIPAPTPSGTVFTDTVTSVFVADIQWLADTGITKGCGTDTFCPDANVTRGEMAAFLRRAFSAAGL